MSVDQWFVTAFLLFAVAERAYERRFSHQAARGQTKMAWSYLALHALHILIYVATAVEFLWVRRQLCWPVAVVGLVAFGASTALRLIAIRTLGRFWSLNLEIRPEHQLVRYGIYNHLRHPAYASIMVEVVAIPLTANAYGTLLALLAYIPLLLGRWAREEREMIAKFGDAYVQYQQDVPAFFPRRPGHATPRTPASARGE